MAAPLEATSEGGEPQNENCIDYVDILRASLKQQNLMYIVDIIKEIEDESLDNLMEYTRNNIIELLDEIHNDKDNDYKIKVVHRNKFAKTIVTVTTKKKEALEKQKVAPASTSSSQVKLLFLGKEEEEAIESIQSGQQFMDETLTKMKKLFNDLDENNKNVKQNLDTICKSLKQQIDEKQKKMITLIDGIYQHHLNELNKRNEETQQSVKVVAKFYNDYESYFSDNKLTKSDRKDKLVAAKDSIAVEVEKLKKHEDIMYDMDVALNQNVADQFFDQFLSLNKIGISLPAVTSIKVKGYEITWEPPKWKNEMVNLLKGDDDNKEENELSINYQLLYRSKMNQDQNENKKEQIKWSLMNLGNVQKCDIEKYAPCEAKIQYTIHNLLQSTTSSKSVSVSKKNVLLPYTIQMSSKYSGPPNTNTALMNTDVNQGCGTDCTVNSWIQVSFENIVMITKIAIAGAGSNMPGGWSVYHLNDKKLQYKDDSGNWIDVMMLQNLQQNIIHEFNINVRTNAMRVHCQINNHVAIGSWRLFGCT